MSPQRGAVVAGGAVVVVGTGMKSGFLGGAGGALTSASLTSVV